MNEREQAREAIAKALIAFELHPYPRDIDRKEDEGISEFLHKAELILSLNGPGWRIAAVRENGELPGWQHYEWPQTTQSEAEMARYQSGEIGKAEHESERSALHGEELAIYRKAQKDMLDAGWVQEVK